MKMANISMLVVILCCHLLTFATAQYYWGGTGGTDRPRYPWYRESTFETTSTDGYWWRGSSTQRPINCQKETELSAEIKLTTDWEPCREILVPEGSFISIRNIQFSRIYDCQYYMLIKEHGTSKEFKICSNSNSNVPLRFFRNVTITAKPSRQDIYYYNSYNVYFYYEIKELTCIDQNSFQCDNHTCILETQVCDGIKQCRNGEDEEGCETGILGVHGIRKSRDAAVSWLLSKREASWGWKENTPRAVVALYLASAANYNGTNLQEELSAQQVEVKIATSLLRPSLTNSELSMFINALLVTCHNPRHFYGNDLVQRLKSQVEETANFTHPLSYLALCNANETWPAKAVADLTGILNSDSEQPFVQDLQAMAHLALSCAANQSKKLTASLDLEITNLYSNFSSRFKDLQNEDGSFGNAYSTALVTQALLASGQENSKDWNVTTTAKYLMKELNSSSVDFLLIYFTLPILNGKTLADTWKRDCSKNPRKGDPITEVTDYLGDKMRVKYSLYVGDDHDVVHTLSLRVPQNYTAFQVMALAEEEDPKYRFEWKDIAGRKYIYKVAGITNDPEHGKFWIMSVNSRSLEQPIADPDNFVLQDHDHLVLWYRTTTI